MKTLTLWCANLLLVPRETLLRFPAQRSGGFPCYLHSVQNDVRPGWVGQIEEMRFSSRHPDGVAGRRDGGVKPSPLRPGLVFTGSSPGHIRPAAAPLLR